MIRQTTVGARIRPITRTKHEVSFHPPHTRAMQSMSMRARGRKKRRVTMSDNNDDDDDDTSVTRRGTAIYFNADVDKKSVRLLSEALDEAVKDAWQTWNRIDAPRLSLWIHSDGGDLYSGLQAFNVIHRCVLPVVTIAEGLVASAATLLHLAGSTRYVSPGTHMLIHQLRSSADGTHSEIKDEVRNNTKLMTRLRHIYLTHTRLSEKRLDKLLKRELELTADECVSRGIAQEIWTSSPEIWKREEGE